MDKIVEDELTINIEDLISWEYPDNTTAFPFLKLLIRRKGIWKFNKFDKDPFPSSPHGHELESGDKIDVYTGIRYNKEGSQTGAVLRKNLLIEIQEELRKNGFKLDEEKLKATSMTSEEKIEKSH